MVEDDAADSSLILNALLRHPNVSAAHAADSPDVALRQLASGFLTPNLVLLDIHMPRMDGFQFLTKLRRIPGLDRVPVVFLTTSALAKDVVGARDSTALTYIVKPDNFAGLRSRLDAVIRRVTSVR
ncbi:MAG: response regulator [Caulobacteraceae bacterium]|nr:response regulator [Caulobacteraceae bacterium]